MPPRPGQLDEISEAIGELKGSLKAIDKYIHSENHGIKDLASKVDGLAAHITREVVGVEARIDARYEARIQALEAWKQQQAGAKNLITWCLQSPLIGWVAAATMFFIALWRKEP